MRLFIKNKLISLRGSSFVEDENRNNVYTVKGKVFSIRRKKTLKNMEGETLYRIQNKFWHFFMHSAYILDADKQKVAKVKQRFSFKSKFIVEGYTDTLSIEGNFWGFNFSVLKNGQEIGKIHRDFNIIRDSFILDCEPENAAFLTALVIAIDNIYDRNTKD